MADPVEQDKIVLRGKSNKVLSLILAAGIILIVMSFVQETQPFNSIKKTDFSLSNDLSVIIINGKKHTISSKPGGYFNVLMENNYSVRLRGWAGDYLGDNKVLAVIFLHNGKKISIIEPLEARFLVRKRYGKDDLLFSGFDLAVNVPYAEFDDYKKFICVALFHNGEVRRLYKVRTFNME